MGGPAFPALRGPGCSSGSPLPRGLPRSLLGTGGGRLGAAQEEHPMFGDCRGNKTPRFQPQAVIAQLVLSPGSGGRPGFELTV